MQQKKTIKVLKDSPVNKQLICFPYVGGAADFFKKTAPFIDGEIQILSVNPPGHGPDILGKPLASIVEMAEYWLFEL